MWDAWAAYDPYATGYFVTEKHTAPNVAMARNEAISYAAFRVLTARYIKSVGGEASLSEFDDLMDALCLPLDVTTTEGDSPAALGNRIAAAVASPHSTATAAASQTCTSPAAATPTERSGRGCE
jgi:hypothetical protein